MFRITAADIYDKLKQVEFNNNDSGNPHTWVDNDHMGPFMNSAIMDNGNSLAYYIDPISSGFDTEDAILDALKHICKRRAENDHISGHNDHYKGELDKPFIFIANTETVLDPARIGKKEGGSHWISWVLLPKEYNSLSGKKINNDKYQVLFFDSLGHRLFPEGLKKLLTEGKEYIEDKTPITFLPFCKKEEIDFVDLNDSTGQQMNGSDCGWWAVYYVLMTLYTGGVGFL